MDKKNTSFRTLLLFFIFALLSTAIWFKLTYPQLSFINLSVTRNQALKIAQQYLKEERGVDLKNYNRATVFSDSDPTDLFLQKSIGFKKEIKFLKEHGLEFFFW